MLDDFEQGFLVGLLVGEGHFGGDGKQPQITLRMHVRHEKVFHWLINRFPRSKLYGPYFHGGRNYYQWMARGPVLRDEVLPVVLRHFDILDDRVKERILNMCEKYNLKIISGPEGKQLEEKDF